MIHSTSTTKIIKALQTFEEQHGESEVLDIIVRKDIGREEEYLIYVAEPKSEETYIVKIPSEDRTRLWQRLKENN